MKTDLRGEDMITTQEWTKAELTTLLGVADRLKAEYATVQWAHFRALTGYSLVQLFDNTLTRSRTPSRPG